MPQARRVTPAVRSRYGGYQPAAPRHRHRRTPPLLSRLPWRWVSLLGGAVLLGWFIWTRFDVRTVNVTTLLRAQEVKNEVETIMHRSAAQGNLLTLNPAKLSAQLAAADPGLRDITVTRRWPSSIVVSATQKQPVLGWSTGNQRYLLDRDGTIIGQLPPASKLMLVVDGSNLPVTIGQRVVTSQFVDFCNTLLASISSTGLSITGLRIQETTFDLYAQTNKGYQLIFDTTRPAADEVADLQTILKTLGPKVPSQYIDLRIAGRAYYK